MRSLRSRSSAVASYVYVRRRKLHHRRSIPALTIVAFLAGCDRTPAYVYVLEAPQSVELSASASAQTIKMGTSVVLHAQRKTQGVWKRIASKDLKSDQCWIAAEPPTEEREVADNVLWRAEPASAAKFNTDFRPDRTREVTFAEPGVYILMSSTGAWCELGRQESAAPITVTVAKP